jgi:uncharacterized protein YtpQ (UPF0354 family)
MTIYELQKTQKRITTELISAIEMDAPRADILALARIQNTIGSQILAMLAAK